MSGHIVRLLDILKQKQTPTQCWLVVGCASFVFPLQVHGVDHGERPHRSKPRRPPGPSLLCGHWVGWVIATTRLHSGHVLNRRLGAMAHCTLFGQKLPTGRLKCPPLLVAGVFPGFLVMVMFEGDIWVYVKMGFGASNNCSLPLISLQTDPKKNC